MRAVLGIGEYRVASEHLQAFEVEEETQDAACVSVLEWVNQRVFS